ncbi:Gfo/Idh/MocA family oxidoreductase [Desulfovibrio sp. JC010]|uniref:Gfo/Idh/MocA family oxidoreductase n=1 Tax=Desulfovibrio sp. JC010 TaxID=2593641 RepID=UPI0013D29553|nr:Gfo/Idh/MocA family oxidoreductase [Desulfovibrio sp. JC010]NDV27476.1 oxidoreductase [Desulfovibrio sp. JC010]
MGHSPKICVIGSGYWGKNLIRNFNNLGSLSMICDKDTEAVASFCSMYEDVQGCNSLSEVLSNEAIDAVAIATPAETHFSIAKEALLAGKHAFVEKPLVLSESEARELINIAEEKNLTLMVGHLLQYHPAFIKLKELVDSGELGRINYIYSHRLNLGKIRREENIFWSFAPHDISMLLSLAGEMPESVRTSGGNYLHNSIADTTMTDMTFPSGLRAHIFVSWLHPFKEQKFVVVADKKMAVFDDTLPWDEKLKLYPHKIHWETGQPIPVKADAELVVLEESEPLRDECSHFLTCIQTGETPRTDGLEGLRVLSILNSGQRSLDLDGQAVSPNVDDSSDVFVHESSNVDPDAEIGKGTMIWNFSRVLGKSRIGTDCRIGQNVVIGPDVFIGNRCKIQNNISVYTGVTLEDDVFCGPSMVFTNVFNPRCEVPRMDQIRSTLVKKGATLGANSTIVCGNTIGRYAFVAAGAVVTQNVADHALVLGNPARQAGWMCECGEKLPEDMTCEVCGKQYEQKSQGLNRIAGS